MAKSFPQPWLEDCLEQLDLRRDDRCLLLSASTPAHAAAVSRATGRGGHVLVIESDEKNAAQIAKRGRENMEVVHYAPRSVERFGRFDALLACPLIDPGLPPSLWPRLIQANLRPGGRFVLDLPAETINEELGQCWLAAGGDPKILAPLAGPGEDELASELRRHGLRSVEASLGTHLLHLESPRALAALVRKLPGTTKDCAKSFERTLVEKFKTTDEVDLIFHRTRIRGLR